MKHYNTMCEASKKRFRFQQTAFVQKGANARKNKNDDDDKVSKKGDGENEDNALCGVKCLTKPKVINAPYIKNLVDDYIRMQ